MNGKKKYNMPHIEVILPNDACSCTFSVWMNAVWNILNEYKDKINISSLTSDSQRAMELDVAGRTVVINGEPIPVFLLKDKLNEISSDG